MIDQLPPNLARFGEQYERAARRELPRRPRRPRRRALRLVAVSGTATAAIVAIVAITVLGISATTGASPAYALTQNSDGSITISLNNLTTGVSQLNARLRALGITDFTVIPVTSDCPTPTPVLVPGPGTMSETITIGTQNDEPAGANGYLAAEQLPDGQIAFASGGIRGPLPPCFSPRLLISGPISPSTTLSATTTTSAPLPAPALVKRHLRTPARHAVETKTKTTSSQP
jgi:hypothetical protein